MYIQVTHVQNVLLNMHVEDEFFKRFFSFFILLTSMSDDDVKIEQQPQNEYR